MKVLLCSFCSSEYSLLDYYLRKYAHVHMYIIRVTHIVVVKDIQIAFQSVTDILYYTNSSQNTSMIQYPCAKALGNYVYSGHHNRWYTC